MVWVRTFGIFLLLAIFYGLYILHDYIKKNHELEKIKEVEKQKTLRQELQQATYEIEKDKQ
jgi:amino acid permease